MELGSVTLKINNQHTHKTITLSVTDSAIKQLNSLNLNSMARGRRQGVAEADGSKIPPAQRELTDGVLLLAADDAAGALDALKSHFLLMLSGIPVPVQVQRQHTVTDIHADMNQLQVCIWRLKHMANSGGSGMRGSAQVTAASALSCALCPCYAKHELSLGTSRCTGPNTA
jgi:hypothetical protein